MMLVAVVTGLSGVGKSWLLEQVSHDVDSQVLSASSLIASKLNADRATKIERDTLRTRDIEENQKALAEAFANEADRTADLVILDAHVMVDTPQGVHFISAEAFEIINPDVLVFIEDEPERIFSRRENDRSRQRPLRDSETLRGQQAAAKLAAKKIAEDLGISFYVVRAGDVAALKSLLQVQRGMH